MNESITDKQLVERVQSGDKQAFDLLVLKYQQRIINLVSRFIHNPNDAQDIAQEAFIKAYTALSNFRGDSAFYTWMYRIAVNTAKNYLTVKSRTPFESAYDIDSMEQIDGDRTLRSQETPERLLLRDEVQETIFKSIEALPKDLKTAITLREIEEMTYEDIATAMDCPIGTVRSRIFRARAAIDKKLKPLIER